MQTKTNELLGIINCSTYEDGGLKECMLEECNTIHTPFGDFIPQYKDTTLRRKYNKSLSFHRNGSIKSISLEEQQEIQTPLGKFPAELLTFYEDGSLHRIFPLNGKITGYWTEEDEFKLTEIYHFKLGVGEFDARIIGIRFYPDGGVRSMTLWPAEKVTLNTPVGQTLCRIGFSLYPNGKLKSFEPYFPVDVTTPIGKITSYNINALGINADVNSIGFNQFGSVTSLVTSGDSIRIIGEDGREEVIAPKLKRSMIDDDKTVIMPITIDFTKDTVTLTDEEPHVFRLDKNHFEVSPNESLSSKNCSDCSSCNLCG